MAVQEIGRSKHKPKFTSIFSKNKSINYLSTARLFLFGSRDIWFVIALPVFLTSELMWSHTYVGGFIAVWVILYGFVQSATPSLLRPHHRAAPSGRNAFFWALALAFTPLLIVGGLYFELPIMWTIVVGLLVFGAVFAINSALHSYLIIQYASKENVSLDVGFYYMANAMGRLIGTVLSGFVFQLYGLEVCLIISAVFIVLSAVLCLPIDSARRTDKTHAHH